MLRKPVLSEANIRIEMNHPPGNCFFRVTNTVKQSKAMQTNAISTEHRINVGKRGVSIVSLPYLPPTKSLSHYCLAYSASDYTSQPPNSSKNTRASPSAPTLSSGPSRPSMTSPVRYSFTWPKRRPAGRPRRRIKA